MHLLVVIEGDSMSFLLCKEHQRAQMRSCLRGETVCRVFSVSFTNLDIREEGIVNLPQKSLTREWRTGTGRGPKCTFLRTSWPPLRTG